MELTVQAVMLSGIDYKENDKLITIFSLEKGKILASIRGVKKVTAKLRFAAEPFCFASYTLINTNGRYTVKTAVAIDLFYELRRDIFKFYAASVTLEITRTIMQEGMESHAFFILIVDTLKILCYENTNTKLVLIRFLIETLTLAGYEIELEQCPSCEQKYENKVFYDRQKRQFVCENCKSASSIKINEKAFKLLQIIKNLDMSEFEKISVKNMDNTRKVSEIVVKEQSICVVTDEFTLTSCLKILDYYIKMCLTENVNSLTDYINL